MPAHCPARVLVADDHAVVREGLRALFERQPDLQVTEAMLPLIVRGLRTYCGRLGVLAAARLVE